MKLLIMFKIKTNAKLIKVCDSKDLIVMGTSIIEEAIKDLSKEMNIPRESSISIIKEILEERVFI